MCIQSIVAIHTTVMNLKINEAVCCRLRNVACTKYHGHTYYCEQSYDGSSGRHMCTKYHGRTLLSTKLRLVTVINSLRVLVLFTNV